MATRSAEVLDAPDRDQLLEWLLGRPLAVFDEPRGDFLVHAGLVPEWTPRVAAKLAREVEAVLRDDARTLFDAMYGNKPDKWSDSLRGMDRLRFVINAFTRMRFCHADGTVDLKAKGAPGEQPEGLYPWFDVPGRKSGEVRVICGHWSTLGFKRRRDLLALDTGCVWGGALTAVESRCGRTADPVTLCEPSGTGRRRRLSWLRFGGRRRCRSTAGFGTSVGDTNPGRRLPTGAASANAGIGPQEM